MLCRIGGHSLRCSARRSVATRGKLAGRKFSVYTSSNAAAPSTASPLGGLTVELDRIAPRFEVSASQITILDSPSSFYQTLKVCREITMAMALDRTNWSLLAIG